ncbi:hypothetical protein C8R47DRAFT_1080594 [Mycena vitilis]|nr:hypothetical protein C8R47DRAFT_1080594 [Mycena vitilis]
MAHKKDSKIACHGSAPDTRPASTRLPWRGRTTTANFASYTARATHRHHPTWIQTLSTPRVTHRHCIQFTRATLVRTVLHELREMGDPSVHGASPGGMRMLPPGDCTLESQLRGWLFDGTSGDCYDETPAQESNPAVLLATTLPWFDTRTPWSQEYDSLRWNVPLEISAIFVHYHQICDMFSSASPYFSSPYFSRLHTPMRFDTTASFHFIDFSPILR